MYKETIKNEFRNCPICNGASSTLFLPATGTTPKSSGQIQVTEKHFGLHGDIVTCKNCGFAYIGRKQYADTVMSLYKEMHDEVYLQEEKERRRSFIRVIKTIERLRSGKKGTILDIGCCTGGLLVEARKRGWQVDGVDPSTWACRMAKRHHGMDIYNGSIESYAPGKQTFDAITMLDVLEHVDNPRLLLNKISRMMKDDGICCIVTPDFGSLTARVLKKRWWGIRLAHLSYFRRKDLEHLFTHAGLGIVGSNTYIRYFSLYYILVRIFPGIEHIVSVKNILKRVTIPLIFFDTFELYLKKNTS